jgi:hypothetical protein
MSSSKIKKNREDKVEVKAGWGIEPIQAHRTNGLSWFSRV